MYKQFHNLENTQKNILMKVMPFPCNIFIGLSTIENIKLIKINII